MSSAEGSSQVEAPKTPRGVGCRKGMSSSLQGTGSGESPEIFFKDFGVKMAYCRALLVLNFVFFL